MCWRSSSGSGGTLRRCSGCGRRASTRWAERALQAGSGGWFVARQAHGTMQLSSSTVPSVCCCMHGEALMGCQEL